MSEKLKPDKYYGIIRKPNGTRILIPGGNVGIRVDFIDGDNNNDAKVVQTPKLLPNSSVKGTLIDLISPDILSK